VAERSFGEWRPSKDLVSGLSTISMPGDLHKSKGTNLYDWDILGSAKVIIHNRERDVDRRKSGLQCSICTSWRNKNIFIDGVKAKELVFHGHTRRG